MFYSDTSLDTTSELNEDDEEMYPDHKIYRKSAIRFSLVQRFRAIISEEESKRLNKDKLPTYKQGSELMGAKIAQPDYADPQKLFGNLTNSQVNLNESEEKNEKPKRLFETVNLQTVKSYCIDTGQKYLKIKSPLTEKKLFCDKNKSSQDNEKQKITKQHSCTNIIPASSDYYEKILEHNLNTEEKIKTGYIRSKSVDFEKLQNNRNITRLEQNDVKKLICTETKQSVILKPTIPNPKPVKRPLKPPPPIPAKPARIAPSVEPNEVPSTKGWVKTVVGRFE